MNLADLRREYTRATLDEAHTDADPVEQFRRWLDDAERSEVREPTAMTLATATAAGEPSARIVLLKGLDQHGFVFFTDYRSRKGRELDANPHAALVFFWGELERQVRVTGRVQRLAAADSWSYFRTRPQGSQIGAWASRQSSVIADRSEIEAEVARVTARYAGEEIPLPPHWGGYGLVPDEMEFWQGRASRLHDRIQYTRTEDHEWRRVRLSPVVVAALVWSALTPVVLTAQQDTARFHLDIPSIMKGSETVGREPTGVQWTNDSKWIYFQWLPAGSDWRAPLANYRVRAESGAKPERITRAQLDSAADAFVTGPTTHDGKWRVLSEQGDLWLQDMSNGQRRRLTNTAQTELAVGWSADGSKIFYRVTDAVFSLRLADGYIEQLADIRPAPVAANGAEAVAATGGRGGGRGAGGFAGGRGQAATGNGTSAQQEAMARDQRELFQVLKDRAVADSLNGGGRGGRGGGGGRGGRGGGGGRGAGGAGGANGIATFTLTGTEQLRNMWVSPRGTELLFTVGTAATTTPTEVPMWITANGYVSEQQGRTNVGDAQGHQRVGVLNFRTGRVSWLDPLADDTSGVYARLSSYGWNDDGSAAVIIAETGSYKTRIISRLDADSTRLVPIETQHDSAWIGGPCENCGGWLPASQGFWWVSEADGYAHIYTMHADGSAKRQLTKGKWEVLRAQLSPDRTHFELTSNEGSPYEQHFWTMALDGSARTRMTARPGGHAVTVSPDGTMLADIFSYTNEPPELYVQPAKAMAAAWRVTTSPTAAWRAFKWLDPEIIEITASDGAKVPAHIYRPEQMGAKPNGAAVLFVHGAGYLQNVWRIWSSSYFREYQFNQLLASKGYVVLDLDYRGSAGYGRDWRTAIYRHMGGRDLDDYVDASKWVTAKYGIGPQHIGIYGGSYGGFMTLMALFTKQQYFGAGAALRPVSDWAHYNHGYTAEILNQPQDDSIAYHQSSPIFFADGLRAPLLIAHGMVDTNVEFEDTVMLMQRLIELGKTNWWVAAYPVEDHGFTRPDSWTDEYRRILDLFDTWLPRGAPGKRTGG